MREIDTLRENIVFLREKNGWTQEQLADRLGIKMKTLAAYEQHVSIPPLPVIVALLKVFVVDFDSLVFKDLSKSMPLDLKVEKAYRKF